MPMLSHPHLSTKWTELYDQRSWALVPLSGRFSLTRWWEVMSIHMHVCVCVHNPPHLRARAKSNTQAFAICGGWEKERTLRTENTSATSVVRSSWARFPCRANELSYGMNGGWCCCCPQWWGFSLVIAMRIFSYILAFGSIRHTIVQNIWSELQSSIFQLYFCSFVVIVLLRLMPISLSFCAIYTNIYTDVHTNKH